MKAGLTFLWGHVDRYFTKTFYFYNEKKSTSIFEVFSNVHFSIFPIPLSTSQPTHVHSEQACSLSAKAMWGSPHRRSAHSPLKIRAECAVIVKRETESKRKGKGYFICGFCSVFMRFLSHPSCYRQYFRQKAKLLWRDEEQPISKKGKKTFVSL